MCFNLVKIQIHLKIYGIIEENSSVFEKELIVVIADPYNSKCESVSFTFDCQVLCQATHLLYWHLQFSLLYCRRHDSRGS